MDLVTQGVIGAAAGQVAGGRALGRKAALVGGLAGLLPDADVLIRSATDPLLAIEQHRGFTHALAVIPLGAAIAAAPFLLRRGERAKAGAIYAAALAGWATHGPLDALTSYGTQLLWPFSDARIALNFISIIDPMITLPLLLGVALAAALRGPEEIPSRRRLGRSTSPRGVAPPSETSEVSSVVAPGAARVSTARLGPGIPSRPLNRARPAALALAWTVAWIGVGGYQHARAASAQEALARGRGHEAVRARVDPTLANVVVWRSLYRTADGRLHADALRVPLLGGPVTVRQGDTGQVLLPEELAALPAVAPAAVARAARVWFWFSDGWVGRVPGEGIVLADHRYAADPAGLSPLWALTLRPDDPAAPVSRSRPRFEDRGLSALWLEVTGRDVRHRPLPVAGPRGEASSPSDARPGVGG